MRYSVRALAMLLLCFLLPIGSLAEGLEIAEEINGLFVSPSGAGEENADYVFRYAYPQFKALTQADEAINQYYSASGTDMNAAILARDQERMGSLHEEGAPTATTEISYQIGQNDERYLSVLLTARQFAGNAESITISANTFARDGLYAGQPLTLSQVLGLEQEGDELSAAQSIAERLAYRLVWEIISASSENVEADYLDGLSEETLHAAFSPESDFYLDEDGNIVFFIQAGVVAGEIAGILTFPFAPAELLSAVKE